MDPILLFFLLGLVAGLLRSGLRLPAAVYDLLIIVLLLSLGLKGGVELSRQPLTTLLPQVLATIAMGCLLTVIAFGALRLLARLPRPDAASVAAHYGSVSVGTFAVVVSYLTARDIAFEEHMPLLVVVLEVPAIVVGILLARGNARHTPWGTTLREVFLGKGIVLLLGGLAIGWIAGADGLVRIAPLFTDLFQGFLALFLLEMGLIASSQVSVLRRHGVSLLVFGVTMPLLSALVGTGVALALGLSVGGTAVMATLAASASYIAVPAAMRISVPEANPTISLTASLGVTFPFNVILGIPLYYSLAVAAHGLIGG